MQKADLSHQVWAIKKPVFCEHVLKSRATFQILSAGHKISRGGLQLACRLKTPDV